jgi:hypothetical protein
MISQLGTVRIKGGGFELRVWTVNVASRLSSTQDVISHVQVTEINSAWIFQRRIHKQTAVNCNSLVKYYKEYFKPKPTELTI